MNGCQALSTSSSLSQTYNSQVKDQSFVGRAKNNAQSMSYLPIEQGADAVSC